MSTQENHPRTPEQLAEAAIEAYVGYVLIEREISHLDLNDLEKVMQRLGDTVEDNEADNAHFIAASHLRIGPMRRVFERKSTREGYQRWANMLDGAGVDSRQDIDR